MYSNSTYDPLTEDTTTNVGMFDTEDVLSDITKEPNIGQFGYSPTDFNEVSTLLDYINKALEAALIAENGAEEVSLIKDQIVAIQVSINGIYEIFSSNWALFENEYANFLVKYQDFLDKYTLISQMIDAVNLKYEEIVELGVYIKQLGDDIKVLHEQVVDLSSQTAANAVIASDAAISAEASKVSANASEVNSKNSEIASKLSETEAKTSEVNSKLSEVNAKNSETNSKLSEINSSQSEVSANASATSAAASEASASSSATSALQSKESAQASETASRISEVNSKQSELESKQSELAAKSSEDNAKSSETASKTSEVNSRQSEVNAALSAASSQASAIEAANSDTSAINAAASALDSKNSAKASEISAAESALIASNAASVASGALIEAGNVDLSSGVYPTPLKDSSNNPVSCYWKVTVGGVVNGIDYGSGDSLVYSKTISGYYKIDNTESVTSVAGKQGVVTLNKNDVGLSNVDNTSDINKPVSTATQSLLDLKVDKITTINGKNLSSSVTLNASDVGATPSSHVGSGGASHATATTLADGFMSKADKSKLDSIAASANNYVHPTSGVTAGTYKAVTVDGNGHVTGGSNPTTVDGYGITDAAKTHSSINFGGSATAITTADFITQLTNLGAFSSMYWCTKAGWSYAGNNYITDTGVGTIQLAGCTVEVIGGSTSAYTIRVHTSPTVSIEGAVPNADFIYVDHGSGYSPKWHKIYNTDNKPTAVDVGALPLTGGTLTGPLTIQSNSASSNLLSILNETDGWTWMKIGKSSLSNQGHFAWHTGPVEGHAENSFHFRPKGSNTVLGISSGAATIGSDSYLEFLPNSNWGAKLRVGGNGRTAPNDGLTASVTTTNGNVHIDGASGSKATYLNFYSGTDGVKFGNGAESVVGTVDAWGNMVMNASVTTPTVVTGKVNGTGSSVNWASLDVSGIKGGYAGFNFTDAGHWFGIRPDGLSGVWDSGGNSKWYFNETGVLTGGAKILWDTIIDHPSRTNWASKAYVPAIVTGQLAWKNYGNEHTIFDASAGTSPDGTTVDKNNSQIAWRSNDANYPTLMGWNGANTYGVRVDSARVSDGSGWADGAAYANRLNGDIIKTNGQDLTFWDKRAMVGANSSNQLIINYGNDWGSTAISGPVYLNDVQSSRHVAIHNGSTSYSNSGLEVRSSDGSDARIGFHRSGHSAGSINHNSWGFQFEREAGGGSRANVAAANFFADAAQDMTGNALTRKDYVDGVLSSKFDKTGGAVSGDITIYTYPIRGMNGAAIVKDHGNGNTTFSGSRNASAVVGDLYLGYHDNANHFTNKVILYKSMYTDNTSLQIINSTTGELFDRGAAVIGANRDNVLNNPSFGVGFLSAHDAGAQWIAGYFGKNGGSNQVVVGEINGGAVIGGHNAAKTAWSDLHIGTYPGGYGNNITHISLPYARVQGSSTSHEIFHRGMFNPDAENRFVARGDAGDCNTAVANGHYRLVPTTPNSPVANFGHMFTVSEGFGAGNGGAWLQQTAYIHDGTIWTRRSVNGTWHGWTRLWDSAGFNPDSKLSENGHYGGTLKLNNWFRSVGDSGWYSETYGGGIYMDEPSTVKVFGGKHFHAPSNLSVGNDMSCAYAYANGSQPQVPNALTRKDYVDTTASNYRWDNRQVIQHGNGDANAHYNSAWDGASVANAPSADWHFFRELYHSGGANWRHQEAFNFFSDEEWFRRGQNSSGDYGPWCRRWHSGNFNPDSKANLSGAAFTGEVSTSNTSISSINTAGGVTATGRLYAGTTVTGTTGVFDGSNRVFSDIYHPKFAYDKQGTATTLWTGSNSSHPTTLTLSEVLGGFSKIRFEGVNAGATIAWAITLSYDELAAISNTGLLAYIASGVYSYTFNSFNLGSTTLTRNTSVNCYLTKIVGIR